MLNHLIYAVKPTKLMLNCWLNLLVLMLANCIPIVVSVQNETGQLCLRQYKLIRQGEVTLYHFEMERLYQPKPANERKLLNMMRQLEHLKTKEVQETVRLGMLKDADCIQSSQKLIDFLSIEIKELEK